MKLMIFCKHIARVFYLNFSFRILKCLTFTHENVVKEYMANSVNRDHTFPQEESDLGLCCEGEV